MALNSIHNGRNFFSDYWLGSVSISKKKKAGSRLTPAQARKAMRRLSQLRHRVDTVEPPDLTTFREKFARPLLGEIFGFSLLENPDETRIRLLTKQNGVDQSEENASDEGEAEHLATILLLPNDSELEARGSRQKIDNAVLTNGTRYGFIMTPSILRLVRKRGEGVTNAYLDFSIASAVETDDNTSLGVAYRILSAESLSADSEGRRPIDLLEEDSRRHSAKVSEDLKEAVFTSAELLIRGFLDDINDRPDVFLPKPSLLNCRDAALKMLYRLLFIFYAECRDERLQNHSFYLKNYSLEHLMEKLLHLRLEEVPGNRFSYWEHLLALFRIYDQGLPSMPGLQNIPPRGGTLFSEKTPEGEFLSTIRLPDRLVVNLLRTLATTRPRRGVGHERVSFRELEIEQLGAVYEGLLEYEPQVAIGTMIDVQVQGKEYVLEPGELCRLCEQKNLSVKGDPEILRGTSAENLHPHYSDDNDEKDEDEDSDAGDNIDIEEDQGVKKGVTARLTRRLESGDFFFVPGSARKGSGSFYTREEIVQYLVRNTLADKVEGKSIKEIEALRVIDPACGSGHFLVGAARYLGKHLFQAHNSELSGDPPPDFYPRRDLSPKVREEWAKEGEEWCKRRIVEKCLYGVDLNPTAVQLAQVALWIESLAGDRPLSFFDHHIRCGNSLLGTWNRRLHQPPHPTLGDLADRYSGGLFELDIQGQIERAIDQRLLIDAELPQRVRKDTPDEYIYKADRLQEAEATLHHCKLLFDLRSAAALVPAIWSSWLSLLESQDLANEAAQQDWWEDFRGVAERERFFHWEIEFPEVFGGEKRGFDAILGNPPWDKVLPSKLEFYAQHDILIRAYSGDERDHRIKELHEENPGLAALYQEYQDRTKTLAQALRGGGDFPLCRGRTQAAHEDVSKYFAERAMQLVAKGGSVGLVLPSVLYNGDGCVGIRRFMLQKMAICCFYAFENRKKIFPIDIRYKFVCLVLRNRDPDPSGFDVAFMRHDVSELDNTASKPWMVRVTAEEIEHLSPETYAFLEYRSPRDQEIVRKMYVNSLRLNDDGPGSWGAELFTDLAHMFIYNASRDKDLWTDPHTGRFYTPDVVLKIEPSGIVATAKEMLERGFIPVFEGKHIDQFLTGIKPVRWWLNLEQARSKYGKGPIDAAVLVFRQIASNTNERTFMAAILPENSSTSHTLSGIRFGSVDMYRAATVLNSFCFDYALRLRTAGTNVGFTYVRPMPIPPRDAVNELPQIPTLVAEERGIQHITESSDLWEALWAANRAVASAYGLTACDFEHILSTFPVFARKRPEFFAYLQERIKEWKDEGCKADQK